MSDTVQLIAKAVLSLSPIAWPVVILVIALLFRKPLTVLISRLKGVKGYGLDVVTQDVDDTRGLAAEFIVTIRDVMPSGNWSDGPSGSPAAQIEIGAGTAQNIYFFSHDIMLCYCALITGAESAIILHTLRSAIAHIEKFAPGSKYDTGLRKLLQEAERCSESDWTEKRRRQDARKLWLISRHLGDRVQQLSKAAEASVHPSGPHGQDTKGVPTKTDRSRS